MIRYQLRFLLGIVISLQLAVDLFFSPSGWLGCEPDTWWQGDWIACGAILAQPVLLAIWAALGPRAVAVGLPRALQFSGLACLSLGCGSLLNLGERQAGQAVIPAMLWLVILTGSLLVAVALRWFGWRVDHCNRRSEPDRYTFSLRRLFGWMLQAALIFAGLRWLDGPLTSVDAAEPVETLIACGGAVLVGIFLAVAAMPVGWLLLANDRRLLRRTSVALFVFTAVASAGAACWWLLGVTDGLYALIALGIGLVANVAFTLLLVRLCGLVLMRHTLPAEGRYRSMLASSQESPRRSFAIALLPLTVATITFVFVGAQRIEQWRTAAIYRYWRSLGWRAVLDDEKVTELHIVPPGKPSAKSFPATFELEEGQIATVAEQSDLTTLDLSRVKLHDRHVRHLRSLPKLGTLLLDGGDVSEAVCSDWGDLAALEKISLEECHVTDEALASVARAPHLKELKLKYTDVSDRGIASLADCENLMLLDLLFTKVTPGGVEQLAQSLPRAAIYATSMDSSLLLDPVPPARWQVIRSSSPLSLVDFLRALSAVRWFYANGGDTDDNSVALLQHHEQLEYLNLAGAKITDAAVAHAKTLTGLKRLDLRRTEVTAAGLAQLRKALPDCEILR